ncbi:MAG: UvrD-helicase domain-containing protein [Treponema sp.]|nr:UvrD-helicase domain-containing protein [Treponema sp.]
MADILIDEYQQKAIDSNINTVVSAGAGSGKTRVLAERFLDLVLNRGCNVDQILTLTFTKKATVEMSSRIYQTLKERAPEQAKIFFKANIKTIDSYCSSIAKMGAHNYGVSPNFTENKDYLEKKLTALAVSFILKHKDNIAIKSLVNVTHYQEVAKQLFVAPILFQSTIIHPHNFRSDYQKQLKTVLIEWEKMAAFLEGLVSSVKNEYAAFSGKKTPTLEKFDVLLYSKLTPIPVFNYENYRQKEYDQAIKSLKNYREFIYFNFHNTKGTAGINEMLKAAGDNYSKAVQLLNFIVNSRIIESLIPLLEEFSQITNDLKRQTSFLTFSDISDLAMQTLKDYPDIRAIEKAKYKAIMIDEFQDNNQMQRDLLFLLAENLERMDKGVPQVSELCPDKLFFVGDEKQSIYRFRGADVSVFRGLSRDFAAGNLTMSINYRSCPALIGSFNTFFGGFEYPPVAEETDGQGPACFYKPSQKNEGIPDYEAIYQKVELGKKSIQEIQNNTPDEVYKSHIIIGRYDDSQTAEFNQLTNIDAEATWICEKIKQLTTEGINGKIYKYSDIAILLKRYTNQNVYERYFLQNGIPYNTEVITGFFGDGPVNDIYSFLKICVTDKDQLAYTKVLRSHFVHLSDKEAAAIVKSSSKPFDLDASQFLNPGSLKKYNHAREIFAELKEFAKKSKLTKIISKLWYEYGYCYETMWNQTVSMYSKMYDYIFELARKAELDAQSLSQFLDQLSIYTDAGKKLEDLDIPIEQTNGVHIMSIHKSKGLEFPVVFVAETNAGRNNNQNSSKAFISKEFGYTVNTPSIPQMDKKDRATSNYFYSLVKEEIERLNLAELRRLTYVAVTRAIDYVFISTSSYTPAKAPIDYTPGHEKTSQIYQILQPVIDFYEAKKENNKLFTLETIPPYDRNQSQEQKTRSNTVTQKLSLIQNLNEEDLYNNSTVIEKEVLPAKYLLPSKLHQDDEETSSAKLRTASDTSPYPEINKIVLESIPKNSADQEPKFSYANFGTIAHAYMEAFINDEQPKISNRDLAGLNGNQKKINTINSICKIMCAEFENSPLGKDAKNSIWHKGEYEFKAVLNSQILKGTIDLVFESSQGHYTVVDYKTNSTIEPEIYYEQLASYRFAVSQMQGVPPENIKCKLFYLRFGKEVDISEETLAVVKKAYS